LSCFLLKLRVMLRKVLGFFLNGLIFSVPLVITVFIVYQLFNFFDGLLPVEKRFPGSGILVLLIVITTIGYFGKHFRSTTHSQLVPQSH